MESTTEEDTEMKSKRLLRRYARMVEGEMPVRRGLFLSVAGVGALGAAGVFLPASPIIMIIALILGSMLIFSVIGAIAGLLPI